MRRSSSAWVSRCCSPSATRSCCRNSNNRRADDSASATQRYRPAMNINLTLLMQAVAFAAFIWFTAKFVWPPLMRAVETRQKQIAEGLQAGEQGRQNLVSAEKRAADMIAEAKSKASEIVATGEKFRSETI